jgi:hypothetical protein
MNVRVSILGAIALVFVQACPSADAQLRCPWLHSAPETEVPVEWVRLPSSDFYEVVASMHAVAMSDLASAVLVPLSVERAKTFNDRYEPTPGKQPYLVRALYGHAATGRYGVLRYGKDLRVYHGSLGHTSVCHESALVVNLDFVPREVYIEVSIAE